MHWDDPEIIHEFLVEAEDHLDEADTLLLKLDAGFADRRSLDQLTGCFHTIKGMSGYVDLQEIQEICHLTETLLGNLAQSGRVIRQRKIDTTFHVITCMRDRFRTLRASAHEAQPPACGEDVQQLIARLTRMTTPTQKRA